jgi:hypothetical protein
MKGKGDSIEILALYPISWQGHIRIELWDREGMCDLIRCQGSILQSISSRAGPHSSLHSGKGRILIFYLILCCILYRQKGK